MERDTRKRRIATQRAMMHSDRRSPCARLSASALLCPCALHSAQVHFDKITARISRLCYRLNEFVDPCLVSQKVSTTQRMQPQRQAHSRALWRFRRQSLSCPCSLFFPSRLCVPPRS